MWYQLHKAIYRSRQKIKQSFLWFPPRRICAFLVETRHRLLVTFIQIILFLAAYRAFLRWTGLFCFATGTEVALRHPMRHRGGVEDQAPIEKRRCQTWWNWKECSMRPIQVWSNKVRIRFSSTWSFSIQTILICYLRWCLAGWVPVKPSKRQRLRFVTGIHCRFPWNFSCPNCQTI